MTSYFTLEELTFSDTASRNGISNVPTDAEIAHAERFLIPGLNQIRELLGFPVKVNSGFRSKALNAIVPGSSDTSQHTKFEAADIVCPKFGTPLQVAKAILRSDIKFDQLIYEYGSWVHISFSENPRRSILSKYTGTAYLPGLVSPKGTRL